MFKLNLNPDEFPCRFEAGSVVPFYNVTELNEGISCVAVNAGYGINSGTEVTIVKIDNGRVTFIVRKSQRKILQVGDFVQIFHRRRGPIVAESIRPGLTARAVAAGNGFTAGAIVTFIETSGSVYGVETKDKKRGSVRSNEVSLYFEYL